MHAALVKSLESHKVPALGAVVIQGDKVTISVAGVRKHGGKLPVKTTDLWHLGSDSKAMTAMLVAILVHEKKLSYERTLAQAFPEFAEKMHPDYRRVTLDMLLRHRSGLPGNLPGGWEKIDQKLPIREQREKATKILLSAPPEHPPGKEFLYSNAGYMIAGHMAERACNATWEQLMRKHVFQPLGMRSAGFGPAGHPDRVEQPWPHEEDGTPVTPGPDGDNPPVMGPAGRVHVSLQDWARFIQDLMHGLEGKKALLPQECYTRLSQPLKGEEYSVGGWGRARGALMHDGSNTMNYCTAIVIPERNLAVLVVCNQGGRKVGGEAALEVRKALLEKVAGKKP